MVPFPILPEDVPAAACGEAAEGPGREQVEPATLAADDKRGLLGRPAALRKESQRLAAMDIKASLVQVSLQTNQTGPCDIADMQTHVINQRNALACTEAYGTQVYGTTNLNFLASFWTCLC